MLWQIDLYIRLWDGYEWQCSYSKTIFYYRQIFRVGVRERNFWPHRGEGRSSHAGYKMCKISARFLAVKWGCENMPCLLWYSLSITKSLNRTAISRIFSLGRMRKYMHWMWPPDWRITLILIPQVSAKTNIFITGLVFVPTFKKNSHRATLNTLASQRGLSRVIYLIIIAILLHFSWHVAWTPYFGRWKSRFTCWLVVVLFGIIILRIELRHIFILNLNRCTMCRLAGAWLREKTSWC